MIGIGVVVFMMGVVFVDVMIWWMFFRMVMILGWLVVNSSVWI